jgi:hypothetical protein
LRIDAAAIKACTGIVALCWATSGVATPAGTASPTLPPQAVRTTGGAPASIRLVAMQPGLAGTCGGNAFDVNTFINVNTLASAFVKVSATGVGTIEEFTDETGQNIGPYNDLYPTFQIPSFGGGLPPNTLITIAISTYSGPNLSGSITFTSTLVFNCTTGVVILAQPSGALTPLPALSPAGLAAMATLLLLAGVVMLRGAKRAQRSAKRRRLR